MFGNQPSALAKEEASKFAILALLYKLKIAGAKKYSVTLASTLIGSKVAPKVPKFAIQLAIVSLSLDFLVLVPYSQRDRTITP